jgi:SAM-dependent methyltransferase
MDDTFEIKDDEINVEEIMKKIKENIAMRKAQGAYSTEDERLINSDYAVPIIDDSQLKSDYSYINNNWNVETNNYFISSHRKFIGPILVKGRQTINDEVKRYVDPSILKQNEYNLHIARILTKISKNLETSQAEQDKISSDISIISGDLYSISKEIDIKIKEQLSKLDLDIKNKAWLAELLSKRLEEASTDKLIDSSSADQNIPINYVAFEDRFRGSAQDIGERQSKFIKYFKGCKNVLDIGCGRGEFLDLAKKNDIKATGVDTNQEMVANCISMGLDVKEIDAISYLESVDDNSIDGIFMDQVVEHLEPAYLVRLLKLCHNKMSDGSYIIIETVNPLCLIAFVNFYIDMTHKRPMHPETLRFLMEYAGYKENSFVFSSPFGDDTRLKKIDVEPGCSDKEKNIASIYNSNMDKLNDLIYGPQDYAVVARK